MPKGDKMKYLMFTLMVSSASPVLASQVSCPMVIKMAVASQLAENNRSNEQPEEPAVASSARTFSKLRVYKVQAHSKTMMRTHSSWLVVVRNEPQATCQVLTVIQDEDIQ